ncbi:MAG: YabP/YqfC family sporulation protein [Bacilli bacterium]|nr:YabP/YqfC family sporulation protein [Bacilli bacterium]
MLDKIKNYIKDTEFRLTLFKDRIYVTNYKKILSLENNNISFKVDKGKVIIKGNNLVLKKLLDKEILVSGKISSIEAKYDQ